MEEPGNTRSSNGFILEPVLILFALTVLFAAFCSLSVQSRSSLLTASQRSEMDLAVMSQARSFAADRSWQRRCRTSGYADSAIRNVTVHQTPVILQDRSTYIEAQYSFRSIRCRLFLYYDETGILETVYP